MSNGVRTITGTIGPVRNGMERPSDFGDVPINTDGAVRMLLKNGYRHVYISRKFATRHGFIPQDAAPGQYGYSGLVK
jgi:hypothetical protein